MLTAFLGCLAAIGALLVLRALAIGLVGELTDNVRPRRRRR